MNNGEKREEKGNWEEKRWGGGEWTTSSGRKET
jgi:hypothetical protein